MVCCVLGQLPARRQAAYKKSTRPKKKDKSGWTMCREHLRDPEMCACGSFRTKRIPKTDGKMLTLCCPVDAWNPRTKHCAVGTKAIAMLRPLADPKCKKGGKVRYEWKTKGYPLAGILDGLGLLPVKTGIMLAGVGLLGVAGYLLYRRFRTVEMPEVVKTVGTGVTATVVSQKQQTAKELAKQIQQGGSGTPGTVPTPKEPAKINIQITPAKPTIYTPGSQFTPPGTWRSKP